MDEKQERKLKLLFELIKNARRSDRELAKAMKISQPTITRQRAILEKEGFIHQYTVLPDLDRMGYEIIAFTFLAFNEPPKPEILKKAREWSSKQPNLIFAADGEGIAMDSIMISVHENYSNFTELIAKLKQDWQPTIKDTQSFIISLTRPELLVKQFSFQYLEATKKSPKTKE